MKNWLGLFIIASMMLLSIGSSNLQASLKTSAGTGPWNTAATWTPVGVPTETDSVVINGGFTVTVNTNTAVCLTLDLGGLNPSGGLGGLTFAAGSQLSVAGTVTVGHSNSRKGTITMTAGGLLICNALNASSGFTGGFTPGSGTLQINAASTLPSDPQFATYNNLFINGGSATLSQATTLNGNLTVGAGDTLTIPAFNFTVTGTTSVAGTLTHNSTTGTKTFTGNVTISAGGVWNETVAEAFTFSGNLQNDGTFTASTGIHTFSGAAKTFGGAGSISIPNVTINPVSATYTNNGTLVVGTALAGNGSLTQGTGASLTLGGTLASSTVLTATATGNTVLYSGVSQTLRAMPYYHLTLNGSGSPVMTGITTISGDFVTGGTVSVSAPGALSIGGSVTLGSGTTFNAGTYSHSVGGKWSNNGATFTASSGTFNFNGLAPQQIGGSSSSTFNILKINNPTGVSLGTAISASTITIGDVTANSLFSDGGYQLPSIGTLNLTSGTIRLGSSTTATLFPSFATRNIAVGTTIEYASDLAQAVPTAISYQNLAFSGAGTKTPDAGTLSVSGGWLVGSPAALNTNNPVVNVTGNVSGTGQISMGAGDLTVSGNWLNSSGTTGGTGVVVMNAGSPSIGSTVFNNLSLNNASGASLTGDVTVNGLLTLTAGTFALGANTLTLNGPNIAKGTGTLSTTAASNLSYGGSAAGLTIPPEVTTVNNFTINNANGIALGSSLTVGGTLTFVRGNISTGANVLTATTITGATYLGYVAGNLQKNIAVGPTFLMFDIGDGLSYTPVSLTFGAVTVSGAVTIRTTRGEHPNVAASPVDSGKDVNRYWTCTNNGTVFDRYSATFNWDPFSIDAGASAANFQVGQFVNPNWTIAKSVNKQTTDITISGMTSFGDFTAGEFKSFSLASSSGLHGAITPTPGATVSYGDSAVFTFVPDTYYHVDSVFIDSVYHPEVTGLSYTFHNITARHSIAVTFATEHFTLTSSVGANGSISPAPSVTVNLGDSAVFTFTRSTGYHLDSVFIDGIYHPEVTGTGYTFLAVASNHTIAATFAINPFTITSIAGTNGAIVPTPSVTVNYGDSAVFTFTPATGYHVDSLTIDGMKEAGAASYTFHNVTANHSIGVTFAINQYSITSSSGLNGTISPMPSLAVNYGDSAVFTITPATGYHVDSLTIDGVKEAGSTSYTFRNVTANHSIDVSFTINQYTITSSAGANGSIAPTPSLTVNYGDSAVFTFTPITGYQVDSLTIDGIKQAGASSYTFHNVTANHSIGVTFAIIKYIIASAAGPHGSISPTPSLEVNYGDSAVFTFTPATGYHVDSLAIDGAKQAGTSSYTFRNITAGHSIGVSFAINQYTIVSAAGPNGAISPAPSLVVNYGDSAVFTFTPATGYHVDSLTIDGVKQAGAPGYTFPNVTENHSIAVTFAINSYTITSSAGLHGAISPTPSLTVNYGDSAVFTITPAIGYHVDSLTIDGIKQAGAVSYTFHNIAADHSIAVTFAIDGFTITPLAIVNGSISPSTAISVNYGDSAEFAFTPATGFHPDSLIVDGVKQAGAANYVFRNVTANHSIGVTFAINRYTITSSAGPNGSIAPTPNLTVSYGDSAVFTCTPALGYLIDSLDIDGVKQAGSLRYVFHAVSANHSISATFTNEKFTITAAAGANGTIAPSGQTTHNFGSQPSFTVTPSLHYHIDSIFVDESYVGRISPYTFDSVKAAHTIRVMFKIDSVQVAMTAGVGGSIAPAGAVSVAYGDSLILHFTPDAAYAVDSVFINGSYAGAPLSYTLHNVVANTIVNVLFRKLPYNYTVRSGNWSDITTWSYAKVPTALDSVVVVPGQNVVLDNNVIAGALNIQGTISFSALNQVVTLQTTGGHSGDLIVSGTINFGPLNSQRITVPGNFICTGTLNNYSAGANGSQISFTGAGVHTISSTDSIGVLRLANPGLVLVAVTPLTITNNLVLAGGKLYLGAYDLTLDSITANIDTGSAASYIVTNGTGRVVRKVGIVSATFPLGTDSSFNRVECTAGHGEAFFHVGVIQGVVPHSNNDTAALRYTVDITTDGRDIGAAQLRWMWSRSDESAQFIRSVAVSWRHDDAGGWLQDGSLTRLDILNSDGTGPLTCRATINNVTTFGHFILGMPGALPVQMVSFNGDPAGLRAIKLTWQTAGEVNSYGFYVERRGEGELSFTRVSGLIAGAGTTLEPKSYEFTDETVTGQLCYYRLRLVDLSGENTYSSTIVVSAVLGVNSTEPLVFRLKQNYPNPFNPATSIEYSVPKSGQVRLKIYDMLGREIAILVNEFKEAGRYTVQWNAANYSSGAYFYRLDAGANSKLLRMMLVK